MHKPSAVLIYGGIGLASFGVACDSGLFGPTDGFDHSAVVTFSGPTGTSSSGIGVVTVQNTIAGDDFHVVNPIVPHLIRPSS